MEKMMEKKRNRMRIPIALLLVLTMMLTLGAAPSFAAAPSKEEVKYLGKGKVEVEFHGHVAYKNVKVTVKDASGKSYKTSVYKKDNDELRFKVKNYKSGKKYKFTVSGVKKRGTSAYGKVKGTFKIKKASSSITAAKAKAIALKDAGLTASQVRNLKVEKDKDDGVTKYEVSFDAKGYEYDYEISLKGKILKKEKERD